ncbi:MAG: hypothetical protein PSX36_11365 [bacterium]|nr:hypothetical protein [bacterium]
MKIKKQITPLLLSVCLTAVSLSSCESPLQKADDPFEIVKKERMLMRDSLSVSQPTAGPQAKADPPKETDCRSDWDKYKSETDKLLANNENKIKSLKNAPSLNAKILHRIAGIEEDNNRLRKQMDEYKEQAKLSWETFKTSMNHEVNNIAIELKDISVSNKNQN